MMNRVYLCGHTGSMNHGCEAIIRSTSNLLKENMCEDVSALTFDPNYDKFVGIDMDAKLIPYPPKPLYIRVLALLRRKLLHDGIWGAEYLHKRFFSQQPKADVLFNVGGDTYCERIPYLSYALNNYAQERKIPTVFWGCSVDERVETDAQMQADINKYSYIVARESISYERLKRICAHPERVMLACDPAFWLERKETPLPDGFIPHNTVGINMSPYVITDCTDDNIMCQSVYELIDNILEKTDMNICLIPHVYEPERGTEDSRVLRWLYRKYAQQPRVTLIDEALSCTQLKYIISQCRFFVGARTHSVIAAYSTGVPALAISYSVKSIGIARDLFGSEENLAVSWKSIQNPEELWHYFMFLMEHEDALRMNYDKTLPEYKETIKKALRIISSEI